MGIARKKDDEIERKINEMEKSKKKNDKITKEKDVDMLIEPIFSNPNSYINVASVLGKHRLVYNPSTC